MTTFYNRMPRVDYVKPKSFVEAIAFLAEGNDGCRAYAGGTDVIPKLKNRILDPQGRFAVLPKTLVDLKGIIDADYIHYDPQNGLKIGALTSIRSVAKSSIVKEKYPMLSHAAGSIASIQVQNRGTIAGNICNAAPSADSAPSLLCLSAHLLCIGKSGERLIEIDDFFTGPGQTTLAADELVKEIQIPALPENGHGVYIKLSLRKKMDCAIAGAAALVVMEDGRFKDVKIGLGAVAATPMRAKKAEAALIGQAPATELIKKVADTAAAESSPITDHRASAEYRKMVVAVLVERTINQSLAGL
jgi:CO/xanthine dehydrogenase FAD-binding subunit